MQIKYAYRTHTPRVNHRLSSHRETHRRAVICLFVLTPYVFSLCCWIDLACHTLHVVNMFEHKSSTEIIRVFDWRNESKAMKCVLHHQYTGFQHIHFAAGIAVRLQVNGWYCSLCCVSLSHRLFSLTFHHLRSIRVWFIWNWLLLNRFFAFFLIISSTKIVLI